jgi:hypothetical protein
MNGQTQRNRYRPPRPALWEQTLLFAGESEWRQARPPPQKESARVLTERQITSDGDGDHRTIAARAQIIPFPGVRSCRVSGIFVGDPNLGGHDGRSALSGKLFCLKCADGIERRRS